MGYISDKIVKSNSGTKAHINLPVKKTGLSVASEAVDRLITEGGEGFYNYVDWIGLVNDSNLVVLSSEHNYYYEPDEMNDVKTVIFLKELNRIKEIKDLLHSHLHFLPQRCNFIGCFINNRKIDRFALRGNSTSTEIIKNRDAEALGIVSRYRFINMLYSILDSKTDSYMSEKNVTSLLAVNGFKVMDMTEYNGLTFFHSRRSDKKFN